MKQIKSFFSDQLLDLTGYLVITVLILFYYYLKTGITADIIYPMILTGFVATVITALKGIRYFRFHRALALGEYSDFLSQGATHQQQEFLALLDRLRIQHHHELSQQMKQKEETYAFVAHMAHDLKIPISVIRLVLEDENNSVPSRQGSEKILQESDKLLDKLSQLLSYLRLGQFEKDYVIERVNIMEEVRNAINARKDYFILNHIYPQFHGDQEAIYIYTDKKWHGMLLDQLISNAVKYSAAKKKEGIILFEVTAEDNHTVLTITDHGIGIPAYDMERIYEPFFTGENGRLVKNSSGIGLYLCRMIADKLGHHLTLHSVHGEKTAARLRYLSKL